MKVYIKFIASVLAMVIALMGVSVFGASAENTETQPAVFIYGDVDIDGKVTVKDATTIRKGVAGLVYLAGVQRYLAAPQGSNVTVKDATTIQKKLAGLSVGSSLVGTAVDMASQDEFSKKEIDKLTGINEARVEQDKIIVHPKNIKWNYTLEDFPEYDFSHIEVTYYDFSKYGPNYFDELGCTLYLSEPGMENAIAALRALDYRANLDLEKAYLIINAIPHG